MKDALREVYKLLGGRLPKGQGIGPYSHLKGRAKWGQPMRGTSTRGYRLDPPHDTVGHSAGWHFNVWDYYKLKPTKATIMIE